MKFNVTQKAVNEQADGGRTDIEHFMGHKFLKNGNKIKWEGKKLHKFKNVITVK